VEVPVEPEVHEVEVEPEHEVEHEEDELEKIERRKPRKIPNQFNFCERAVLTYDNPMRVCILNLT
jgi:dynein intermediate chain 1